MELRGDTSRCASVKNVLDITEKFLKNCGSIGLLYGKGK